MYEGLIGVQDFGIIGGEGLLASWVRWMGGGRHYSIVSCGGGGGGTVILGGGRGRRERAYWHAICVSSVDPTRRRNGDERMAEVYKHINAAPLCQPVIVASPLP